MQELFRLLPSVDELVLQAGGGVPHELAVQECRAVLEDLRAMIRAGEKTLPDPLTLLQDRLRGLSLTSLRRVINATGVVLHTNLGRAPLAETASPGWYSNLEYDLRTGRRGKRDSHTESLLDRLLGVPGILVNNGAAAVFLALHELASGGEVIVSRGELVEIGDGFRIPDIMARSGAVLVEVGTTNRTRVEDYERAITDRTRLLMRVHPSNFRMQGFTGRASIEELAALGKASGVPVYEDLGSGSLTDLSPFGVNEPTVQSSLRAGADLVSFSGDKLLGGPQAGVLAGREDLVQRLRRNPMFRALRLDKLVIGAMETALRHTLLQDWAALPVMRMIRLTADEIKVRAERLAAEVEAATVVPGESLLGGGSTPEQALPTWLVAPEGDASVLERQLREGDPAVIGRIEADRLLLDLRTVRPEEEAELAEAIRKAR
ncbi:L-seryl-tRNA(Sec) selenium transferase [Paludibaculum fermentans]|uniref:L-seryl-tRNA(Sec) selenium transferase n=1 Tax=Paludibaculum fermentans TaxID=1473598 RepID=A0A7S7NXF6_PALFE|nr:L-seryl-tRNA(Sec) selenium transferase [Paludibaculum fermentans]QOY91560.1 L-seryl-tRNA(Sec) selenium transferase [Paludibaculum fermentans]